MFPCDINFVGFFLCLTSPVIYRNTKTVLNCIVRLSSTVWLVLKGVLKMCSRFSHEFIIQVIPEVQDILCLILEIPDKLCTKYKRIVVVNFYSAFHQNVKYLGKKCLLFPEYKISERSPLKCHFPHTLHVQIESQSLNRNDQLLFKQEIFFYKRSGRKSYYHPSITKCDVMAIDVWNTLAKVKFRA